MIKILFLCHGNICRSTMAQYVLQDMVNNQGIADRFYIDSAATSYEEIGNGVHPGTRNKLKSEGIPCGNHRARHMEKSDYNEFDYIIGMDSANIRNIGRRKISKLLKRFDSPKEIYNAGSEYLKCCGLSCKDAENIISSVKDEQIYRDYNALVKSSIKFTHPGKADYPAQLMEIYDYPYGLYYNGKLPDSDKPSVAIVGSRQASQYGMMVAARLAYEMSSYGIQIISGMAVGIDTAAHKGTLDNSGYTCAVLGSGVDICYPACNIGLFTDIKKTGGVMSEYPAGVKPVCGQFPERNRLISGLSDAVVVVEARAKSGSLITVDQALEQNKDVYVIPGRVGDSLSEGCNELIKSGAYIMTKAEDILECDRIKNKLSGINGIPEYLQKLESVSQFELATPKNMVYSCVDLYPVGINELINKTGLSLQTVSGALVELELEGKIKETAHNCYARV